MAEDMESLRNAVAMMLPDDGNGRPVIGWDRIRAWVPLFHIMLLSSPSKARVWRR
jgi:hypothetical protein